MPFTYRILCPTLSISVSPTQKIWALPEGAFGRDPGIISHPCDVSLWGGGGLRSLVGDDGVFISK